MEDTNNTIFTHAKIDPTVINGGVINSFKSNAKLGKGEWAILEADESDGSFLKLPINYSIVTNIDFEQEPSMIRNVFRIEQHFCILLLDFESPPSSIHQEFRF